MLSLQLEQAVGTKVTRRSALRIGALGGLTLPWLLRARAEATVTSGGVRDTSVVLATINGGPSQFETFDPKMEAPVEIRSVTGEVRTKLPGITFGGTFPRLAELADKLTVVRSFRTFEEGSVPFANLFVTMARQAGIDLPAFADSTGPLSELVAS